MDEETKVSFPPCPFCGTGGLTAEYDSFGTTLYCEGCHGSFNFPAFPQEVSEMWLKNELKEWASGFLEKFNPEMENMFMLKRGRKTQGNDAAPPKKRGKAKVVRYRGEGNGFKIKEQDGSLSPETYGSRKGAQAMIDGTFGRAGGIR